ncbi:MAG TPA: hypothetical protein VGH69_03405, partial [Mycobacterium sp.]
MSINDEPVADADQTTDQRTLLSDPVGMWGVAATPLRALESARPYGWARRGGARIRGGGTGFNSGNGAAIRRRRRARAGEQRVPADERARRTYGSSSAAR